MEDPAEDLFTLSVRCRQGNVTVFEGLREGNSFYLQRVLDVLEGMPDRPPFAGVCRSIFALLALSDMAARRVGLPPGMMGESQPVSDLPKEVLNHLGKMRKWVQFSDEDLQGLNIDLQDLSPFVFRLGSTQLDNQALVNSSLERAPVLRFGTSVCLALPTSVGSPITLYLLKVVAALGKVSFLRNPRRSFIGNFFPGRHSFPWTSLRPLNHLEKTIGWSGPLSRKLIRVDTCTWSS